MICTLCGHRFEKDEAFCRSRCPLGRSCGIICCPRCDYQDVEDSMILGFARRLLAEGRRWLHPPTGGRS